MAISHGNGIVQRPLSLFSFKACFAKLHRKDAFGISS